MFSNCFVVLYNTSYFVRSQKKNDSVIQHLDSQAGVGLQFLMGSHSWISFLWVVTHIRHIVEGDVAIFCWLFSSKCQVCGLYTVVRSFSFKFVMKSNTFYHYLSFHIVSVLLPFLSNANCNYLTKVKAKNIRLSCYYEYI